MGEPQVEQSLESATTGKGELLKVFKRIARAVEFLAERERCRMEKSPDSASE